MVYVYGSSTCGDELVQDCRTEEVAVARSGALFLCFAATVFLAGLHLDHLCYFSSSPSGALAASSSLELVSLWPVATGSSCFYDGGAEEQRAEKE
ncbi:hypothetical protein ABZP36_034718 [Zizania latifolia]